MIYAFAFVGMFCVSVLVMTLLYETWERSLSGLAKWVERRATIAYLRRKGHEQLADDIKNNKHHEKTDE